MVDANNNTICTDETVLVDHSLTTYSHFTANYQWRKQEFNLNDWAGHSADKRVRIIFELTHSGVIPNGVTVNDVLGWMLDNIEVRGDPFVCELDLNGDGLVDDNDVTIHLTLHGPCVDCDGPCVGDFNRDGVIDTADLGILINNQGPCP